MKNSLLKKIGSLAIAGILTLSVTAYGAVSEDTASVDNEAASAAANETTGIANETKYIRVGEANKYYLPFTLASELGYLEEELGADVEVEFIEGLNNGSAVIEAANAGELDIITLSDQPVITGIANSGAQLTIVANLADNAKNFLVVGNADKVSSAQDLVGKTVAVPLGTAQHKALVAYLTAEGVSPEDVDLVNLSSVDEIYAAYTGGDIEAASIGLSKLQDYLDAGAVLLSTGSDYTSSNVVLAGRNEFLKENPETVAAIIRALSRAIDYINENPDEAVNIKNSVMEDIEGNLETIQSNLAGTSYAVSFDQDDFDDYQNTAQFGYDNELFSTLLDVAEYVDSTYYEKAFSLEN